MLLREEEQHQADQGLDRKDENEIEHEPDLHPQP